RHYVQYLRRHHRDTRNAEAQLYGKYSFPFGSLVMVLIAIPFAFLLGRQGALSGIGVAVAISMVYWGTIGVFKALGGTGLLPPLAAAFLPLLIFGALGTWLFSKIRT
ncbi:MAG TPA: LptF/LptG family permease, partial [Candidatus Aminicenantes bacterium]|nr:LptF/LptG family permease [Candidatus Aminicenantes bacterium]